MHRTLCSLFILAAILACVGAVPYKNTTIDCQAHNPNCDGNGVCMNEGICRCFFGYKGDNQTSEGCPYSLRHDETALNVVIFNAVIFCVAFTIVTALCIWRIYLEVRSLGGDKSPAMRNITKWVLSFLAVQSLAATIINIDQGGIFKILGPLAFNLIGRLRDWGYLMIFSSILLHWIELYQKSLKTIKKQEMLQKMNSRYQTSISLEDILIQISFLRRFRIPYFFFSVITLGFCMAAIYVEFGVRSSLVYWMVIVLYYFYLAVLWIGFLIGFLWFGFRLGRIMPSGIEQKVKKLTWSVAIIVIILTIYYALYFSLRNIVVSFKMSNNSTAGTLFVFNSLDFGASLACLNIYMPLKKWRTWFTTSFVKSNTSTNKTAEERDSQDTNCEAKSKPIEMGRQRNDSDLPAVVSSTVEIASVGNETVPPASEEKSKKNAEVDINLEVV